MSHTKCICVNVIQSIRKDYSGNARGRLFLTCCQGDVYDEGTPQESIYPNNAFRMVLEIGFDAVPAEYVGLCRRVDSDVKYEVATQNVTITELKRWTKMIEDANKTIAKRSKNIGQLTDEQKVAVSVSTLCPDAKYWVADIGEGYKRGGDIVEFIQYHVERTDHLTSRKAHEIWKERQQEKVVPMTGHLEGFKPAFDEVVQ